MEDVAFCTVEGPRPSKRRRLDDVFSWNNITGSSYLKGMKLNVVQWLEPQLLHEQSWKGRTAWTLVVPRTH